VENFLQKKLFYFIIKFFYKKTANFNMASGRSTMLNAIRVTAYDEVEAISASEFRPIILFTWII